MLVPKSAIGASKSSAVLTNPWAPPGSTRVSGLALLHPDKHGYPAVPHARQHLGLDFDDACQFALAESNGLTRVTQDSDFERVKREISVRFI
jgi:predicted nucleic acid-binding protein